MFGPLGILNIAKTLVFFINIDYWLYTRIKIILTASIDQQSVYFLSVFIKKNQPCRKWSALCDVAV